MQLKNDLFKISSPEEFEALSLQVFRHQYEHTRVYKEFCDHLKIRPSEIQKIEEIPFLPISFFKTHSVISEGKPSDKTFISSGTTGSTTSKHAVGDLNLYEASFANSFTKFYGAIEDYAILALLPSYLERQDSSLIYMVDKLIKQSGNPHSEFYLNDLNSLSRKIEFLESTGQKTILLGVSYALLDLIELRSFQLKHTIVMETGGMKGRRKEMIKPELHHLLKNGFGVPNIHSEYGMTELLSQAYSQGDGLFRCPPWMKILTRDTEDAFSLVRNKTGGINVIDLANVHSCSFIATQDLGRNLNDNSFEILGRFDNSDIRGCNLMVL